MYVKPKKHLGQHFLTDLSVAKRIADSLRALEESDRRMALEKQRLEILRMRATGAVDVPDPDGAAAGDLDAPLEEDTEE